MSRTNSYRTVFALAVLLCLAGSPAVSHAQYMYLDSNGDGVWSAADRMQANGTPTTVDVWVNTNHNKDGSLAVCDTGDGDLGTWNSYAVNLGAVGGTVSYGTPTNLQPTFTIASTAFLSNGQEMKFGWATGSPEAGGLKRMFTVVVTGVSGAPGLTFLPYGNLGPDPTSFGTPCSGNDFDNTYKQGSDWFDWDGLPAPISDTSNPVIAAPATVGRVVNSPVSITATATDPDAGQLVTLSQTNNAPFLSGPGSVGPITNPSMTLSGTPSAAQVGLFAIQWSAADNMAPAPGTATATTTLLISPAAADRPATISAPTSAATSPGTHLVFFVSASDPDGDPITSLTASGSAITAGGTFTTDAANSQGTFNWTPGLAQQGAYSVTFTAANALSSSATTIVTVSDRAPGVTAPPTASIAVGSPLTVLVSAADPDGESITSLTAAGTAITAGALFTQSAANTSGTLSWTPGPTQAGTYGATFTASNVLSGSAATQITVTNPSDRAPVVTAPATAAVGAGSHLTVNVTVADPDGDAIASLTASGTAFVFGASFTPSAFRTAGTLSWTPDGSVSGGYSARFTATNALSGSATTLITVAHTDVAPIVVVPPAVTAVANFATTFAVFASDVNGDGITSLTASSLPAGAAFITDPSNVMGTFTWTPSLAQVGSHEVTFTAANILSRSATTMITVLATPPIGPYMYMDTNGDGVFTSADRLQPNGTPTTVSVWVNTNHSRDGSPATCDTGDGDLGTWNSYAVNIGVTGGNVAFSTPANDQPTFAIQSTPFGATATEMKYGKATGTPEPGGLKRMFTVVVTGTAGTPALTFLPWGNLGPDPTSFGTPCSGKDFDNTYKLGSDWFDHDGAGPSAEPGYLNPTIAAPAAVQGNGNAAFSVTASASDPDAGQLVTLSQTNNAPFLAGPASAGPITAPSITLSGTPTNAQAGVYTVSWSATDGTPAGNAAATTTITIVSTDRGPVATVPATVTGAENTLITFTVTAADPDGDAITSLTASGSAITAGGEFTANATNTSGTFSWTPTATQAGTYRVTFVVSNGPSEVTATEITVTDSDPTPPVPGNLVGNYSFETSTAGWAGLDGGVIQRVAGGLDGAYALEIRGPAVGTGKFSANDSPNWILRVAGSGAVYRFTAWVKSNAPAGKAQLRVREYAGRIHRGTAYSPAVSLTPTWQMITVDRAAIDGGSTLDWQIMDAPLVAGEAFQTDNVSIQLVSEGTALAAVEGVHPVMAPNPLNPEATLSFTTTEPGQVRVRIFDPSGRHVRTLIEETNIPAGRHSLRFNGRDHSGRSLASGIYFYRIEADHAATTGRFAIVK